MKVILLAAGYATRLYPLTKDKPKSLLDVAGKPMIEYIFDRINEVKGLDKVYIVSNARFYNNFLEWAKGYGDSRIEVLNDNTVSNETRLGGIGDMNFVIEKKKIEDDVLVISGDNLFDFNLNKVIKFLKEKKSSIGVLYDVEDLELVKLYSCVEIDDKDRIISFEEKPKNPKSTLSSIGIYIFKKEDLKLIKGYLEAGNNKDGPGYLIKYFSENHIVHGCSFKGRWFDIGDLNTLKKINEEFKNG